MSDDTGVRRLVLLLARASPTADVARHAVDEVTHLQAALGPGVLSAAASTPPAVNPMLGTGSMMASSDFAAAVEVDLADRVRDDAWLTALDGFNQRHAGALAMDRSAALVGRVHQLRPRALATTSDGSPLKVIVALRAAPGLSLPEFQEGWLNVGRVNARNHPTCIAYSQLHADVELSEHAMARSGLSLGPFWGLAVEVFPTATDLQAGHEWAKSPASVRGADMAGEHLMALLGQVVDFASAGTLLATSPTTPHSGIPLAGTGPSGL